MLLSLNCGANHSRELQMITPLFVFSAQCSVKPIGMIVIFYLQLSVSLIQF